MALDRHNIEKKDFPLGRRGYDPDAVDAHLSGLADEITTFKEEARRRSDTVASSASDQVRTIVEAAEQSASEIHRTAEDDAREIREEANSEANTTRENAQREAREYLDKVSASTNAMLERLNAMEQEMSAMVESVRTGSTRLNADLQQLEGGLSDVSGAIAPRPEFVPDQPAADTFAAPTAGLHEPGGATGLHGETADMPTAQPDALQEPQFAEHFQSEPVAEEPAAEAPPAPEAAEFESVAGDGGHTNGFDQPQPIQQGGDAEGARLIALNMALNGTPREETARYLSENFHLSDAGGLLDEVYASVES
ncbi:MAG TPA: DivIVA domain-containing protein [Solirubrobacteraceae bacterium]|nr:DivIVA domain-containing protein [Solirubrobacteraceae bacterium]